MPKAEGAASSSTEHGTSEESIIDTNLQKLGIIDKNNKDESSSEDKAVDSQFQLGSAGKDLCQKFSDDVIAPVAKKYSNKLTGGVIGSLNSTRSRGYSKNTFFEDECYKGPALEAIRRAHTQSQIDQQHNIPHIGVLQRFIETEINANKLSYFKDKNNAPGQLFTYLEQPSIEGIDQKKVKSLILNHFWEACKDLQNSKNVYAKSDIIDDVTRVKMQGFIKVADQKSGWKDRAASFERIDAKIHSVIMSKEQFNQSYIEGAPKLAEDSYTKTPSVS